MAAIAKTKTPDETLAATARAVVPDAVEAGWDLAGSAAALAERKRWEKGILKANPGSELGDAKIDGVWWRVLYKEDGGKTYAIKLGRLYRK